MVRISVGMMGSSVASGSSSLATPAQVQSFLNIAKKHGVKELDTARVYNGGKSEELLGEVSADKDFIIATKAPAFAPGSLAEDKIISNCEKSLAALKMKKVDIYYLHGPDHKTSFEEQCRAVNKLYKEGKFDRWGISNLSAKQVQEVWDICEKEDYVKPRVYQGGYNPLSRPNTEDELLPLLKKLKIQFYVYSPLAGGLLAKPIAQLKSPEKGSRFDEMKVFGDIYLTKENIAALEHVQSVCDEAGIKLVEATMRWFMHHAPLEEDDAVILGASRDEQLENTLTFCENGPLPESVLTAMEDLKVKAKIDLPSM